MTDRAHSIRRALPGIALALLASTGAAAAAPDISGTWLPDRPGAALIAEDGKAPPLLPAAKAAQAKAMATFKTSPGVDPEVDCLPPGVPRLMQQAMPFDIVQGRRTVALTFQWNHLTRLIYMDRAHFEPIGPLYLGQSVGHWEGDTLVVDTNSFNATTWLDDAGLPHGDGMTTLERIRLLPGGKGLEDRITITDPATFSRPWTARITFHRALAGTIVKEDYCLGRVRGAQAPARKD